jgi:hypothetical protein
MLGQLRKGSRFKHNPIRHPCTFLSGQLLFLLNTAHRTNPASVVDLYHNTMS